MQHKTYPVCRPHGDSGRNPRRERGRSGGPPEGQEYHLLGGEGDAVQPGAEQLPGPGPGEDGVGWPGSRSNLELFRRSGMSVCAFFGAGPGGGRTF